MPLTDNGYEPLDLDQEIAQEQSDLKACMGEDLDVSIHSPMGQFIQKLARRMKEADEDLEYVYDSAFTYQADGVSLDRKGSNFGVQRRNAQSSVVALQITGTPGYVIPAQAQFLTSDGTTFINTIDTQIDSTGNAEIQVYSEDQAAYVNVNMGTIDTQANPVDEIETVTNKDPAVGGADLETDYDYRRRIAFNEISVENGTVNGLHVAMLNVAGVTGAKVIANRTKQTDAYGNPPNTVHIYVMGGDPKDIAQKILDVGGGETQFVGNIVENPLDSSGHPQEIRFDAEKQVMVKFAVDLQTSSSIDTDAIKQSIIDYLESKQMGDDVILTQVYGYLYQIDGVDKVTSLKAGIGDTLGTDDVSIEDYQLAITDNDSIEVTIDDK